MGKVIFIGLVIGLLLIANTCIDGKLRDRENAKCDAVNQISAAAGNSFIIKDIYVEIPYTHTYTYKTNSGTTREEKVKGTITFPATSIIYDAKLQTQMRTIGIYSSPIYTGNIKLDCVFDINIPENINGYEYFPEKATARIAIKEKSIISQPTFNLNEVSSEVSFAKSNKTDKNSDKQSELISSFICKNGKNTLSTTIDIRGARKFQVMLTSTQTKLSVKSDWTSPGFSYYDYLPDSYEITDEGFTASWYLPFSSTEERHYIGFDYIQSVDIYMMLNRAIDYGFLFIIVPFIVLFLFDVFLRTNFHPLHYLLSGAASVIFFLLLLSFSEHIDFALAYLISALASGLLVSFYVAAVTRRKLLGCSMCGVFVLLYGYLYFSLKSEDYALLIGSLFSFIVLAVIMVITRKVDWNNFGSLNNLNKIKEQNKSDLSPENNSDLIEQ